MTAAEIGISVQEAARRIGCDPSRIRKLVRRGLLAAYRDGRRVRVLESSVRGYQSSSMIKPEVPPPAAPAEKRRSRVSAARHEDALARLRAHGLHMGS